jgi:GTP cyclohydrolase IA
MTEYQDKHIMTHEETPMHEDYLLISNQERKDLIAFHFKEIMLALGLDLNNDSLNGTPHRVAKMYVDEIFSGLYPENKPSVSIFENSYQYGRLLVEKNITIYSACEHHFLPIVGQAHVGYVSNGHVVGLSKINRLVQYYCRRPQVQERLTLQIARDLQKILNTEDVIVVIDAKHLCVSMRGVEDTTSSTVTMEYGGCFNHEARRKEFLDLIN